MSKIRIGINPHPGDSVHLGRQSFIFVNEIKWKPKTVATDFPVLIGKNYVESANNLFQAFRKYVSFPCEIRDEVVTVKSKTLWGRLFNKTEEKHTKVIEIVAFPESDFTAVENQTTP